MATTLQNDAPKTVPAPVEFSELQARLQAFAASKFPDFPGEALDIVQQAYIRYGVERLHRPTTDDLKKLYISVRNEGMDRVRRRKTARRGKNATVSLEELFENGGESAIELSTPIGSINPDVRTLVDEAVSKFRSTLSARDNLCLQLLVDHDFDKVMPTSAFSNLSVASKTLLGISTGDPASISDAHRSMSRHISRVRLAFRAYYIKFVQNREAA